MNAPVDLAKKTTRRERLVVIHGIGATPRCWDLLLPLIEDRYEILNVTLRGHYNGKPLTKGTRHNVKSMADGVAADMDELGWDQAHIIGNSLGGWIALELGSRGRALSVTALAPGGGWKRFSITELRLVPRFVRLRTASYIGLPIRKWLMKSPWRRRAALIDTCERGDKLSPETAAFFIEAYVGCKIFWRIMFGEAFSPMLKSSPIDAPVTIVWGNKDAILPIRVSTGRWQKLLPDAEWHIWLGVGHMPMVDEPERTADVLEATISQVTPLASVA